MTALACRKEIERFLARAEAEVLCVTGKWGVGKTFAWKKYLLAAKGDGAIALDSYAYVSLFGLGSLDDVKRTIFENTVDKSRLDQAADLTTLEGAVGKIRTAWRSGGQLARIFAPVADYAAAFEKLGFMTVRKQLICFDDLERKSKDVDMRDILGLISFLKEQRQCKIVILLNDEKLGGDDEEYRSQLEKVADTLVKFEPTPEEATEIGIDAKVPGGEQIKKDCIALGIVNIRTIKRICRWAERLQELIGDLDPRVLKQAVHSATLFGYAKVQPDVAPTLDFLRQHNSYSLAMAEVNNQPIEHPEWVSLLRTYDFTHIDDLDARILDGIEHGHFDEAALREAAEAVQAQLAAGDDSDAFTAAWDRYHGSFKDDAEEVMDGIAAVIRDKPRAVTPLNLSGSITMLKELGWGGDIAALIAGYVAAWHDAQPAFWNLDQSSFSNSISDPDVRAAFACKVAAHVDARNLKDELIKLGTSNGWNPSQVAYLAAQPAGDYRDTFKALTDDDLNAALRGAFSFKNIIGADADMLAVTAAATEALKMIASESPINSRRVRMFGIAVEDPQVGPEADA